jgi:hypothetical protein
MTEHLDEAERAFRELTDESNLMLSPAMATQLAFGKLGEIAAHLIAHLRSHPAPETTEAKGESPRCSNCTDEDGELFTVCRRCWEATRSSSAKDERIAELEKERAPSVQDCRLAFKSWDRATRGAHMRSLRDEDDYLRGVEDGSGTSHERVASLESKLAEAEKTIEAWRPVVEAAKAWSTMCDEEDGHEKTEALEAAVDALGGGT